MSPATAGLVPALESPSVNLFVTSALTAASPSASPFASYAGRLGSPRQGQAAITAAAGERDEASCRIGSALLFDSTSPPGQPARRHMTWRVPAAGRDAFLESDFPLEPWTCYSRHLSGFFPSSARFYRSCPGLPWPTDPLAAPRRSASSATPSVAVAHKRAMPWGGRLLQAKAPAISGLLRVPPGLSAYCRNARSELY